MLKGARTCISGLFQAMQNTKLVKVPFPAFQDRSKRQTAQIVSGSGPFLYVVISVTF